MLCSYNVDYAATRGGVLWIFYCWTFVAKVVIYYWLVFGSDTSLDGSLVGAVGIYAVLFFTPILYCILSFRATRQLYGPPSTSAITVENMLHADMVVHVMLDLLDLITAFHYADLPAAIRAETPWIHTLIGCFITIGLFMHSYSFPTTAGGAAAQKDPHQPAYQGDIFLTRKHAALVGMFLVDIPLMFVRIYLWVTFPKNPGFSPFLIKNVIFLPLQAFRLNQCRLAERERAKSSQRKNFYSTEATKEIDDNSQITATNPSANSSRAEVVSTQRIQNASTFFEHDGASTPSSLQTRSLLGTSPIKRKKKLSQTPPPSSSPQKLLPPHPIISMDDTGKKRRSQSFDAIVNPPRDSRHPRNPRLDAATGALKRTTRDKQVGSTSPMTTAGDLGDFRYVDSPTTTTVNRLNEGSQNFESRDIGVGSLAQPVLTFPRKKVEEIIKELKSVRQVPVKGFGLWKLTVKIFHCLRVGGRHGLSSILDESFVLGYWKQIRIALPIVVAWSSQIALVALTRQMINDDGPVDVTKAPWKEWEHVSKDYRLFVYFAAANLGCMFVFWVGTAPFFDVIFVCLMWIVRFCSFFLVFVTIRDTKALELETRWHLRKPTQPILIWIFIVLPCLRLLYAFWPIQSAFLGRKYMYFVVPSANRKMQTAILATASTFKENQLDEEKRARSDESGWVTTSSILVFLTCRHSLAPMSFGELLIGPDLIKDVRLMDTLVARCWLELGFVLLIHIICLILFFNFVNLGIFSGHIVMQCIYNIFIQAIRLLALRRYEVKILFEEIVNAWGEESYSSEFDVNNSPELIEDIDGAESGDFHNAGQRMRRMKKKRFISLLDIIEKYQRHGFFTSPGDLIPNFI